MGSVNGTHPEKEREREKTSPCHMTAMLATSRRTPFPGPPDWCAPPSLVHQTGGLPKTAASANGGASDRVVQQVTALPYQGRQNAYRKTVRLTTLSLSAENDPYRNSRYVSLAWDGRAVPQQATPGHKRTHTGHTAASCCFTFFEPDATGMS